MGDVVSKMNCANCGAWLYGQFCHGCGQKATAAHLELHDVVHEATHEFLHLDGKIINTVKVLVTYSGEPGRRLAVGMPRGPESTPDPKTQRRMEDLQDAVMHNLPRMIFAIMPVYALLTLVFFRRRQPYFVAHFYYSVHVHAFTFFAMAVSVPAGVAGKVGAFVGGAAVLSVIPYHFLALRGSFGESW